MSDAETELKALKLNLQHAAGYKVYRCACVLSENDTAIIECDLHRDLRAKLEAAEREIAGLRDQIWRQEEDRQYRITCVNEFQSAMESWHTKALENHERAEAAYIAGLEAAKEASQGCVHAIQCVLEIQKLIDAKKAEP